MATVKKYAGLPDLDLGTEVYETAVPDLTEASTLPTGSDTSSENGNSEIDRQELHPEAARQFFEPAIVDARHVNFSDTINGGRRSYQIRTRRRRRRAEDQAEDDSSDDSQEETLQGRLARLRKEAVELQADIERAEGTSGNRDDHHLRVERDEDGDSVYEDTQQASPDDLSRGVEEVNRTLNDIHLAARKKKTQTLEEEFISRLSKENQQSQGQPQRAPNSTHSTPESSLAAVAAFSDRLGTLESLLGVSPLSPSSTAVTSVLPTLSVLTAQIETLYNTLTPRSDYPNRELGSTASSTAHLEPIAEKIRQLISESKLLEQSRKAASKSFEEFLENRDRHANLFHSHTAAHPTSGRLPLSRAASGQGPPPQDPIANGASTEQPGDQLAPLFLDSQASKINTLYNVLPTIQNLEPLLPVVLERLRALSVMHAGAADVKGELDELEQRLRRQEEEVAVWRGAVERIEGELKEGRTVLKGNVEVVGRMVGALEGRVRELKTAKQ